MRKTAHIGFYGHIRSEIMQIPKVKSYCQNAKCKHKHKTFDKSKMVMVNEYLFCSSECAELLTNQIVEN